jgi:hypothetical protein
MYLSPDVYNIAIGLGILVGAIQCFFGYRFFKVVLGLLGFLAGGILAAGFGYSISQQEIVALLAGLVGGLIGAGVLVMLYFIGIFFIGAYLGTILGAVLFGLTGIEPGPMVLLIPAVAVGIFAIIFQKFMIIFSTGFGGAWSVVAGLAYFTTGAIDPTNIERLFRPDGIHFYAVVLGWLALGITGVAVQYRSAAAHQEETGPDSST